MSKQLKCDNILVHIKGKLLRRVSLRCRLFLVRPHPRTSTLMYPAGKMVYVRNDFYRKFYCKLGELHISQPVVFGLHQKYCSRIVRIALQSRIRSAIVIAKGRFSLGSESEITSENQ